MLNYTNYRLLKGFTIIELLVVVIIIGVLGAIAMPLYSKVVERARISDAVRVLGIIREAQMQYWTENNKYSYNLTELSLDTLEKSKYFTFGAIKAGTPPSDGNDDWLATALRNKVSFGVYGADAYGPCDPDHEECPPVYSISIYESGKFYSDSSDVQKLLSFK